MRRLTKKNPCHDWGGHAGGVSPQACSLKKGCVYSPATSHCEVDNVDCSHLDKYSDMELAKIMSLLNFGSSPACMMLTGQKRTRIGSAVDSISRTINLYQARPSLLANRTYREQLCDCLARLYPQLGKTGTVILFTAVKNVLFNFFDREFLSWTRAVAYVKSKVRGNMPYKKKLYLEFLVTRGRISSEEELSEASKASAEKIKEVYFNTTEDEADLNRFEKMAKTSFEYLFSEKLHVLNALIRGVGVSPFTLIDFLNAAKSELPFYTNAVKSKANRDVLIMVAKGITKRPQFSRTFKSFESAGAVLNTLRGGMTGLSAKALSNTITDIRRSMGAFMIFMDIIKQLRSSYHLLTLDKQLGKDMESRDQRSSGN